MKPVGDAFASAILLLLALIVFNQYRRGTLSQWARAKFLNAGAPVAQPGDVSRAADGWSSGLRMGGRGAAGGQASPPAPDSLGRGLAMPEAIDTPASAPVPAPVVAPPERRPEPRGPGGLPVGGLALPSGGFQ